MPQHEWKCEKCGEAVTVLRSIGDHGEKPGPGEAAESDCEHEWKKFLGAPPALSFSTGWAGGGGGKGRWTIAACLLGGIWEWAAPAIT